MTENIVARLLCLKCEAPLYSPADRVSSYCAECRAERLQQRATRAVRQTFMDQASHSLTAQGLELGARFVYAIAEGHIDDVLAIYKRILTAIGRAMSDAEPIKRLLPLSTQPDRWAFGDAGFGAALRNVSGPFADRDWRSADAAIKGLAYAEARLWRERAEALKRLPPPAGDGDETDDTRQAEIARQIAQSRHYLTLSVMEGWR